MRAFLAIVRRDLRIEGRARQLVPAMVLLALLLLTVASAAGIDRTAGPAVLWLSVVFAVSFALARSFEHELEDDQLSALVLAPVGRATLYLGKAAANLLMVLAAEVIIVAAFTVLYNIDLSTTALALIVVVFSGTVGMVALGTLLGAMIAVARLREALLPLLLLPLAVPAVVAAVRATEQVLAGHPLAAAGGELQLLAAFALLCVAVPVLVFDYVVEE